MKISFLILQYNNSEDTLKCVKSINDVCSKSCNIQIVIVDNASPRINKIEFESALSDYSNLNVEIIYSKENVGFSKGNNLGYMAVVKFNPDYLCVTNNDIIFKTMNFDKIVDDIYNCTKFDILGPDIYSPENKNHQNPLAFHCQTKDEAIELKTNLESDLKYYNSGTVPPKRQENVKNKFKQALKQSSFGGIIKSIQYNIYKRKNEIILHGSCLIVSQKYILRSTKMFYPETFMYHEEYLLGLRCKREKFKTIYSPRIKVIHNNGKSVETVSKDMVQRMIFSSNAMLHAVNIYINELENQ
mgnify:CR=1 FL=1